MSQKSRIWELLEHASKIDAWLDPLTQDKSRLSIIQELVILWDFINTQKIIQDLYLEKSIQIAESIFNWSGNIPTINNDNYLKYAERQENTMSSPNKNLKLRKKKELSDYEKYEELVRYIDLNKNIMSTTKLYQTRKKLSKINDEELKIILEKRLWLWKGKPKKKKIEVSKTGIYKNTSLYQTRNVKNLGKKTNI